MISSKGRAGRKSSILSDVDYNFTVMLLGDSCTGKTCLLIRFKDNTFMSNNFISTVGIDYRNKLIELDKHKVKLQVWDTAGQERFRSLTASYYRDADALLLIYDVTNRGSFENIRDWLAQVREHAKEEVELTLVGNKVDLGAQQRKVRAEEGKQLAQAYNIPFMETSAKTGQNVHPLFVELTRRLLAASLKKEEEATMDDDADADNRPRRNNNNNNGSAVISLTAREEGKDNNTKSNGSAAGWIVGTGGGAGCCA